jgi:N-acetylmuramoyl-L-alanine amidase
MRAIKWIVVHTSATADKTGKPVDATVESIRRYHVEHNGWKDIGYHYVVRMNGLVEHGRPIEQPGAHVGGFNDESIGICVSGHGDVADFTDKQHAALASVCAHLCKELAIEPSRVIGHREADDHGAPHVDKTCPGVKVNMDWIRSNVAALMPKAKPDPIADLQRRVAVLEARAGIG